MFTGRTVLRQHQEQLGFANFLFVWFVLMPSDQSGLV